MSHSFERVEQKFLLESSRAETIIEALKKVEKYRSYTITTYYLESPDYSIYHMKKERISSRFKIRIREYKNQKYIWLELKEKSHGMGYKNRFKLDRETLKGFIMGKECFEEVKKNNKKVDTEYLSLLYSTIQKLIKEYNLKPTVAVSYSRLAFDSGLKGAPRYTFDYKLTSRKITIDDLFIPFTGKKDFDNSRVILELKTCGTHPELMENIKREYSLKRDRFSKFIFAMEAHFLDISATTYIGNGDYTPLISSLLYL